MRQTFGAVSPNAPLFFHDEHGRNRKLGSVKSDHVKSAKVMCRRCNDTRTQPFDQDWATLSAELERRSRSLSARNRIKLRQLFPGWANHAARNIHLYFVKLFGCRIAGEDVPLSIDPFANAIQNETICDGLSLIFCRDATHQVGRHAFVSAIQARYDGPTIVCAGWTYALDRFYVEVMWFKNLQSFQGIKGHWNPNNNGTMIKLISRE